MSLTQYPRGQFFTVKGKLTERAHRLLLGLVSLDIMEGTGSPEGVVTASTRRLYMDNTGVSGSVLYIKRDSDIGGDKSMGWVAV